MKIRLDDFCKIFEVTEECVICNLPICIVLENNIPVFYIDPNDYANFITYPPKETALQFLT